MSSSPDHFLRRAHRRARFGLLVWSLGLAALACALHLATSLHWLPPSSSLVIGHWTLVISSALALTIWTRRSRRLSTEALARQLDAEWALAARLETSAELESDRSALATAQRADTARHLATRPAPSALGWFSGIAVLALAAVLLLIEGSIFGLRLVWPAPAIEQPAALPPDISASLVWKTPESEIKATAIEEIPLTALASTRTGFRSLSLEVAVNGEPRLSRSLAPDALAPFAKPGQRPVELDLFLDEVGAQEFDLVSYHLRAERATAKPTPIVASALQFIQIRPPREDVGRIKGGGGSNLDKLATLLGNLKAAQLQLLKQNFLLAHAPIDHALPVWREENTRVAAEQKLLAQKTAEARDYAIAESMPTLVVDNLGQCLPLMDSAATQIAAAANEPAAKPQGQALGLIVAAEKLIRKVIIEGGGAGKPEPTPKNHDPFKDKQTFKLPPRADTPAGQLEQLAQGQADAAQKLTDPASGSTKKDPLAEQADLAAKLAALDSAKSLAPAAQDKTAQAAKDAAEAARQLEQGDKEAARAPAAAAAQTLREATAAQEAAGRAAAQAELEKIRRDLNAAERLADPGERAAALADAAGKLRAEALAQQQTGSAEAARQLAAAAAKADQAAKDAAAGKGQQPSPAPSKGEGKAPGATPGEGEGAGKEPGATPSPGQGQGEGETPGEGQGKEPGKSPGQGQGEGKGEGSGSSPGGKGTGSAPSASEAAAQAQAALAPRDQALARAARQLARASQAGQGAGTGGGGGASGDPGAELELGAQLAAQLLPDPAARDLARKLVDDLRDRRALANTVVPPDLRSVADKLVVLLEAARQAGQRDEQVRRFNPDDLDPAYREAVEAYFEKLSRDAVKP